MGFPGGSVVKESACQCRRPWSDPWVKKIPWRRKWQPTSIFLLEEFHGQRSLVGYYPQGRKESAMIEHTHIALQIFQHIFYVEILYISEINISPAKSTTILYTCLRKQYLSTVWSKKKKKKILLNASAHFEETKSDWNFHYENLYITEKQIIPLSVLCTRWTVHLAS